jgi:hypothetical protein
MTVYKVVPFAHIIAAILVFASLTLDCSFGAIELCCLTVLQ